MKSFAALALAILLTPAAQAQHQTLTLIPDASQVHITLNTNHEIVNGTFHLQSGTINFDPAIPKLSGSITVLAATGNTGSPARDKRMNNEILKASQFTNITFEPKSYTGTIPPTGDTTLQVTGIFTLLGTPHEITIPMQVHLDPTNVFAKAHFTIPYVQWGLKDPSLLIWKAEKNVTIDLTLSGHLTK